MRRVFRLVRGGLRREGEERVGVDCWRVAMLALLDRVEDDVESLRNLGGIVGADALKFPSALVLLDILCVRSRVDGVLTSSRLLCDSDDSDWVSVEGMGRRTPNRELLRVLRPSRARDGGSGVGEWGDGRRWRRREAG